MANLLDIKRRIKSVKNTQQITKAMKMVAAAKLRRSQDRILATRPYALELLQVVAKLAERVRSTSEGDQPPHPLLATHEGAEKELLVVVTGDRGLAGSFNAVVLRRAQQEIAEIGEDRVELLLLGKKGADFFRRRELPVRASHRDLFSGVTYEAAEEIARDLSDAFSRGEYGSVRVIYNQFESIMVQRLETERLLPLSTGALDGAGQESEEQKTAATAETEYLYEPSASLILADLLPRYVTFQIYRVLLESQAAEHAARMTAMDSATKNAGEMIEDLTLTYNRARQAAITTELIEVVSGANALEG